jgi:hypothetical protein
MMDTATSGATELFEHKRKSIAKIPFESGHIFTEDVFGDVNALFFLKFKKFGSEHKAKLSENGFKLFSEEMAKYSFDLIKANKDFRYNFVDDKVWISDELNTIVSVTHVQMSDDYLDGLTEQEKEDDEKFVYNVEILFQHDLLIAFTFAQTLLDISKSERKKKEKNNQIHIFEKEGNSLQLTSHTSIPFKIELEKHYNDGFVDVDTRIREWLDTPAPNKKLVLLNGKPGTGKTNYIKHLLNHNPEKKKIYIPPFYISALTDPSFFSFIKQYAGSTLVIEDAEKILMKREMDGENSAISVLLNLCDGILANVLDFRLIISFNTEEKNIDPALLRKGRLFLKYKFDNLSEEKTEALYREVHNEYPPEQEMSLAEIYNSEENGNEPPVAKPMGFL